MTEFKKGDKVEWFGVRAVVLEDTTSGFDVVKVEESKTGLTCEWYKTDENTPNVFRVTKVEDN